MVFHSAVQLAVRQVFRKLKREPFNWFAGHVYKGQMQLQQRLRQLDCVIELHDARTPISGRNFEFLNSVTQDGNKPYILVLNKKDLTDRCDHLNIKRQLAGQNGPKHIIFTNSLKKDCQGVKCILPHAINLIKEAAFKQKTRSKEYHIIVVGMPGVGKRTFINNLYGKHLAEHAQSYYGNTKFKINNKPPIFLLHTPAIIQPVIADDETGLKLTLIGVIPDHIPGEEKLAEYLLYWLNAHRRFEYVPQLGLRDPDDNIIRVLKAHVQQHAQSLKHLAKPNNNNNKNERNIINQAQLESAAKYFVKLFRTGELGAFNLDESIR